jgi:hypothetical protein
MKLIKFFFPFFALLGGCASFHAEKFATDGSHIAVDSNRLFVQDEIGAINFGQSGNDVKLTVQGITSQGQMEVIDALNNLAKVVGAALKVKLAFKIADPANWIEREIAKKDSPFKHSHVEVVFSDGSAFSSRAYASGHDHKQNGTSFIKQDFPADRWDVVDIPMSAEDEQKVHDFCVSNDGEGYDFDGVFAFKAFLFHEDPNKWFCSEIATAAMQVAGNFNELIPHKTSPDLLFTAATTRFPSPCNLQTC